MATNLPAHPDTISGLAPDCRRILRDEYSRVQVAADRQRLIENKGEHWVEARNLPGGGRWEANKSPRRRTTAEVSADVSRAVAEYRRVAAEWGVEV